MFKRLSNKLIDKKSDCYFYEHIEAFNIDEKEKVNT